MLHRKPRIQKAEDDFIQGTPFLYLAVHEEAKMAVWVDFANRFFLLVAG